ELDPRRLFAGDDELFDLVHEPADLGLLELVPAQLLRTLDADAADAIDRLLTVVEAASFELPLRLRRGVDRGVHVVEDAPHSPLAVARRCLAVAHVREDFLNDVAD